MKIVKPITNHAEPNDAVWHIVRHEPRFAIGVIGLGLTIPGYSHVLQALSEIGEIGSPARAWRRHRRSSRSRESLTSSSWSPYRST